MQQSYRQWRKVPCGCICIVRLTSQRDSLVRTLFLPQGCSGRSPACPLCSGHVDPSIRPFPEEMSNHRRFKGSLQLRTFRTNWKVFKNQEKAAMGYFCCWQLLLRVRAVTVWKTWTLNTQKSCNRRIFISPAGVWYLPQRKIKQIREEKDLAFGNPKKG